MRHYRRHHGTLAEKMKIQKIFLMHGLVSCFPPLSWKTSRMLPFHSNWVTTRDHHLRAFAWVGKVNPIDIGPCCCSWAHSTGRAPASMLWFQSRKCRTWLWLVDGFWGKVSWPNQFSTWVFLKDLSHYCYECDNENTVSSLKL